MPSCLLPIRVRPRDYQPEDRRHRAEGRDFMSANIPKHPDLPAQYGSVETSAIDWSLVEPYRFGSRTAEFLIADAAASIRRHLRDTGRRPRSDQRQLSRQSSRFHPATRARRSRRRNSRRPPCPPRRQLDACGYPLLRKNAEDVRLSESGAPLSVQLTAPLLHTWRS